MFIAGYATEEEIAELEKRGWEIESAEGRDLVGPEDQGSAIMTPPDTPGTRAVLIFADNSLFEVMSGFDWDLGSYPLNVSEVSALRARVKEQIAKLQSMLDPYGPTSISARCTHKYADGKDASSGVPVSGERWCACCGRQWD
jgi:hypothetical protein